MAYPLPETMLLVLCATLAAAEDFVEVRRRGAEKLDFLRTMLPFAHGTLPRPQSHRHARGRRRTRGEHVSGAAVERRSFLSSLPLDAILFARAVRAHWGIENRPH